MNTKLFFILIFIHLIYSQFSDINTKIDSRQVRDSDKYVLDGFSEKIESYFETTDFDQHLEYLNLSINIQLIIESISKNSNDIIISTQLITSNNLDQYYYTKGADISYNRGKSLTHSHIFDSISSLLDYYAYLYIATELDTYSYMGGNLYFNKCLEIATLGLQSNFPRGWEDRKRKCDKIKEKIDLRNLRYNFFLALDELNKQDPNKSVITNAMKKIHDSIIDINLEYGRDRSTIQFISAYCHEIGKLCKYTSMYSTLNILTNFDENNKKIYESYLK